MSQAGSTSSEDLVEVRAAGIRRDVASETFFLVLEDVVGDRSLVVTIGSSEALAIATGLQHVVHGRPSTHDAMKQAMDALGAEMRRVIVGFQPEARTFTADVVLATDEGREQHLDWRVSDSAALAVRYDPPPPILVPERLLADPPGPPSPPDPPPGRRGVEGRPGR